MSTKLASTIILFLLLNLTTALTFNIAAFANSGSPHSIVASISFFLSSNCTNSPLANVLCYYGESVQPSIATTIWNVPCNDTSVSFGFQSLTLAGDGYYLNIIHVHNASVDAGLLYMGKNVDTVTDQANPNGDFQHLVHEEEFVMEFNSVDGGC